MTIHIASDHAGFTMKEALCGWLRQSGHEVHDAGPANDESVDYPDYARVVAQAVAAGRAQRGVLVCGSGIGMAIAANRTVGVRAVNAYDATSARLSREHNDANVITLGSRLLSREQATSLLGIWLDTPFSAGRHLARVAKIEA